MSPCDRLGSLGGEAALVLGAPCGGGQNSFFINSIAVSLRHPSGFLLSTTVA